MSRAFLIFCTLLAVFISVSGFISAPSPVQFFFVPIPLFLLWSVFQKYPDVKLSHKRNELAIAMFFLGLLLVTALFNIYYK